MSGGADPLSDLLASPHVTPATREVLEARRTQTFERRFFTPDEFTRLRAVAVRLVPHDPARLDLAGAVDDRLASGVTDGWRYADTPPDGEACRALLAALPPDFAGLGGEAQDAHLRALQDRLPHPFEDLLADLTETYYSQPDVQYALGSLAFADAPGWAHVGLDEAEPRERAAGGPS